MATKDFGLEICLQSLCLGLLQSGCGRLCFCFSSSFFFDLSLFPAALLLCFHSIFRLFFSAESFKGFFVIALSKVSVFFFGEVVARGCSRRTYGTLQKDKRDAHQKSVVGCSGGQAKTCR